MVNSRCCSRTACKQPPVYTLTYVYKDSTAVLGPLAAYVDPHSWDLCEMHAARLVVPRGWDVVRLPPDPAQERADDLEALANIVRDVGRAERAGGERGGLQARPAAGMRPAEPRQAPRRRPGAAGPPPRGRRARAGAAGAARRAGGAALPGPAGRAGRPGGRGRPPGPPARGPLR